MALLKGLPLASRGLAYLIERLQQRQGVVSVCGKALPGLTGPKARGTMGWGMRGLLTSTAAEESRERFSQRVHVPVPCNVGITLQSPGNVKVAKGAMESVAFEVTRSLPPF